MKASKTQISKTNVNKNTRHSGLSISGKDPKMDYCWRRRADIEEGGGQDHLGYIQVTAANHTGEASGLPFLNKGIKTNKTNKTFRLHDVVLAKRTKEAKDYFKGLEDEKYNSQIRFIKSTSQRARVKLRQIDSNAVVVDQSSTTLKQRPGPSMEEN